MAHVHLDPIPRNATPGHILRFVAETAKIDGELVGKIQFQPRSVVVEIPDSHAARVVAALDGAPFRERNLRARLSRPMRREGAGDHFDKLLHLLTIEAGEEERRVKLAAAERRQADDPFGSSLAGLTIRDSEFGQGGRLLLTLVRKDRSDALPPNRLQPGSPAQLTQTRVQRPHVLHGVVFERDEHTLVLAVDESDEDLPEDAVWRLDLSADEVSRLRQASALMRAQAAQKDRLAELRAVLLGEQKPSFQELQPVLAPSLNAVQADAVAFALAAEDVAIIHGPPGTGKTTTLVELIRLAVARGDRVLACAPSNAAVDNLLEKLLAVGLEPVRLGHPARIAAHLRERALDLLVENHPSSREIKKLNRQATTLFRQADKWTKEKPLPGEKAALRHEAREFLTEARRLESEATERILDDSTIICATLTGLDSELLGRRRFTLAVLDEAAQSTEPACWIPLLRANRVVLAGDPCQLPATVLSSEAAANGLKISLMERLIALHPGISRLLTVQYRMHADIMGMSNIEFYNSQLLAHESVIAHRICECEGVESTTLTEAVMTFIDTAGAGYDEEFEEDTSSRRNPQEADLAVKKVRAFLAAGISARDIAVITPYSGQVRLIRERLKEPAVEVDSVDGFQGREKEVVVISFVRSNPEGEIGFLADLRRTNVAMTRARRRLLMIGDSATLCHEPFYARLIEYCEIYNSYATIWEEPE